MDMVGWTLNKSEVKAVYQSKKKMFRLFQKNGNFYCNIYQTIIKIMWHKSQSHQLQDGTKQISSRQKLTKNWFKAWKINKHWK